MGIVTKHSLRYDEGRADAPIEGTINEDADVAERQGQRRPPFGANGKLKYLPMLCPQVSLQIIEMKKEQSQEEDAKT